jgi:AbrB family looped-hinge helix DNA binding protein
LKVVAYKGQYRITIPKEIAEEKEWEPGTKIKFIERPDGTIILKKVEEKNARKKK